MKSNSKILVIGHNSLAGSWLLKRLKTEGYKKTFIISSEDLIKQEKAGQFFKKK